MIDTFAEFLMTIDISKTFQKTLNSVGEIFKICKNVYSAKLKARNSPQELE